MVDDNFFRRLMVTTRDAFSTSIFVSLPEEHGTASMLVIYEISLPDKALVL
jgi:hypothetical protein